MISSLLILTTFQANPKVANLPKGSDAKFIGKYFPMNYGAVREPHTLPSIAELSPAKRKVFTGSVITIDYPQLGMKHVMNYRNGKRVVFEKSKQGTSENGVPLTKMLTTLPPKIDIRFALPGYASFEAKLPGSEKKLTAFTGTLTALARKQGEKGISILMENGKVFAAQWLSEPGIRH
jgi:hypothetical protein